VLVARALHPDTRLVAEVELPAALWSDLLAACRATGVSPQEYIANTVTIRLNRSTQAERREVATTAR